MMSRKSAVLPRSGYILGLRRPTGDPRCWSMRATQAAQVGADQLVPPMM
jgi:hypothetical protein